MINQDEIQHSAQEFVSNVSKILPQYNSNHVINTDQAGIQLELYSTRTLSHKGEKITVSCVRSKNATMNSFTVQPCISLAGKLVGPLFLCLKEPSGRISDNIKVSCSDVKLFPFRNANRHKSVCVIL